MQSVLETFETQFLQSNFLLLISIIVQKIVIFRIINNIYRKTITNYAMKSNIIDTIN